MSSNENKDELINGFRVFCVSYDLLIRLYETFSIEKLKLFIDSLRLNDRYILIIFSSKKNISIIVTKMNFSITFFRAIEIILLRRFTVIKEEDFWTLINIVSKKYFFFISIIFISVHN